MFKKDFVNHLFVSNILNPSARAPPDRTGLVCIHSIHIIVMDVLVHIDEERLLSYLEVDEALVYATVDKKRFKRIYKNKFTRYVLPIYWESARFDIHSTYYTSPRIRGRLIAYAREQGEEWASMLYTEKFDVELLVNKIKQLGRLLIDLPVEPPRKRMRYGFL